MASGAVVSANTVVFTGIIDSSSGSRQGQITFRVTEVLNGSLGKTALVSNNFGSCTYGFQSGVEYLVYASSNGDVLSTTACAGNNPVESSGARIEQLRAARDRKRLPDLVGVVYGPRLDPPVGAPAASLQPLKSSLATGVVVVAKSDTAEYRTRPNDAGLYSFWGLPPGAYTVSLEAAPGTNPANPPTLAMQIRPGFSCAANLTQPAPRSP